jgi:hypothetical protein
MLQVLFSTRMIRLARRGRIQPWLGPAFRGLTGGRLKAITCRQTVADQLASWSYCQGCPLQDGCAYGETFEPDPPPGVQLPQGQDQAARPIVFDPQFPLMETPDAGYTFPLRIIFIGPTAITHADDVWESLRIGGADLGLGLGEEHIPFDVLGSQIPDQREEVNLPLMPANDNALSSVGVELTSPLFLNQRDGDKREPLLKPSFADLLRAGLRALGPLHKLYGIPLPEEVFAQVKSAAEQVQTRSSKLMEFQQGKWSHRTKERFVLRGVIGQLCFEEVPQWLIPWLEWAGRLHVGTHRVAGAGGWQLK